MDLIDWHGDALIYRAGQLRPCRVLFSVRDMSRSTSWLVSWCLALAISDALAAASICLPNVTFTGNHDEGGDLQRGAGQSSDVDAHQTWVSFRIDGPYCRQHGQCCATDVRVGEGALMQHRTHIEAFA